MTLKPTAFYLAIALTGSFSQLAHSQTLTQALSQSTVSANFNLRYENVDQDNNKKHAQAVTLRTRLNYTTGLVNGFSAVIEFEDARSMLGLDDYNSSSGVHF